MRICHAITGLHPSGGGPPLVVLQMSAAQIDQGGKPDIVTIRSPDFDDKVEPFIETVTGRRRPRVTAIPLEKSRTRLLSPATPGDAVRKLIDASDVVHIHGLWQKFLYGIGRTALKSDKPLVIRPAGMLEPWALSHKTWRKKIGLALGWRDLLNRCACLHATAQPEADQFRRIGLDGPPVAVIPNGVDTTPFRVEPDRAMIDSAWPELAGKKLLLFLSRIHPKKGLLNLAAAWGKRCDRFRDWHLVIAGPDQGGHQAHVARALDDAGAAGRYTFTGPVYDQIKAQLLRNASLFVLPTFSENFGVVVVESLAAGVPVITTRETPWAELETHQCGWWIETGEPALSPTLEQAMQLDDDQRRAMGRRGRDLVADRYAWPAIAEKTLALYRWLHHQTPRPDFVAEAGQRPAEPNPTVET